MYPGLDESEFRPDQARRDREVTLGPVMLGALGVGLVALCCACFLAGYEVGNHGSTLPGLKGAAMKDSGRSAIAILEQSKPAAVPAEPAPRRVAPPVAVARVSTPAAVANDSGLPTADPPPAVQLRPAVQTTATNAAPSALQTVAANPGVHPALAQVAAQPAAAWHVQIAAVEQKDDADVLVSALRQRGYAVSVRHDLIDNLLHVQVGPFRSESDAEAMRQKLMGDGYNAVILH